MLTTDISGTYDYEQEMAHAVADDLLADLKSGYFTPEQFAEACAKERAHWAKFLDEPGSLDDFLKHFNARLRSAVGIDSGAV